MRRHSFVVIALAVLSFACFSPAAQQGGEEKQKGEPIMLKRGVNIIGYDSIWRSTDQARFKEKHFKLIAEAGFDHVRIVLHVFRHMDENDQLSDHWWEVFNWALAQAKANGLAVIVDCHEFGAMAKDPEGSWPRLQAFWRQLAPRLKDEPDNVYIELLNEPHKKLTPELWNEYLEVLIPLVRESNPQRQLIIGPGHWNSRDYLDSLALPEEDKNIIVTFHYYDPFKFTHQGASWSGNMPTGVKWQGTDKERKEIKKDFDKVAAWSAENKRGIYLGEFGAYDKGEMASRVRWTDAVTREAEAHGFGWGYWQFDSDFILYDIDADKWITEIRNALIPLETR
jgi:endoglucanase